MRRARGRQPTSIFLSRYRRERHAVVGMSLRAVARFMLARQVTHARISPLVWQIVAIINVLNLLAYRLKHTARECRIWKKKRSECCSQELSPRGSLCGLSKAGSIYLV